MEQKKNNLPWDKIVWATHEGEKEEGSYDDWPIFYETINGKEVGAYAFEGIKGRFIPEQEAQAFYELTRRVVKRDNFAVYADEIWHDIFGKGPKKKESRHV
ncbi:MAG: hypothetical protein KC483_10810 [Nitrosarchaeum sp.]|nr:hypothetical protein [Nitrosarchaeum sp.]